MRRALFGIGLCLFGVLLAAPLAAASGPGGASDVAGAPAVTEANPALWHVQGPKGDAYLLGSIHALPKNIHWQTPQILAAIGRADTFVFEIPLDDDSRAYGGQLLVQHGLLPSGTSLPSYFDQDMRDDYRDVIMQTHADPTNIVYLRPWLATLVLQGATSGQKDLIAAEGVDNKVYAMATARGGRHFSAFETWDQQFQILMELGGGGGNMDAELEALRQTLKQILKEQNPDRFAALLKGWSKGDLKALISYGPGSTLMSPETKKILLENRNKAWIPKLIAMLDERHTYFITVGAAHLVGPMGVPNLLRAAGYKVDGPEAASAPNTINTAGPLPPQLRVPEPRRMN